MKQYCTLEMSIYIKSINGSGVRIGTFGAADAISIQQDNGYMGIGTTNPSDKLEVNGNISVTGGTSVGNSSINGKKSSGIFGIYANSWGGDGPSIELYGNSYNQWGLGGNVRLISNGSTGRIVFSNSPDGTSWPDQMVIQANGNVGIGTITPQKKLHITDESGSNESSYYANSTIRLDNFLYTGEYTIGSPIPPPNTHSVWDIANNGVNALFFNYGNAQNENPTTSTKLAITYDGNVGIGIVYPLHKLQVDGNISISGANSTLIFGQSYPTPSATWGQWAIEYNTIAGGLNFWKPFGSNNSGNYFLFLKDNGNIGIGTDITNIQDDYKLFVNGKILCERVRVINDVPGADYVFDNNYNLKSLKDIEDFIAKNKHLPEIPSADEMKKDGIDLTDMNILLLKKVEELTLYIIDLKKENDKIKAENEKQNERIFNLENK